MRGIVLLLGLLYCVSVSGQTFKKIVYSVDDGLVTHLIKAAQFDSIGYLWIGTDEGLVRYDGREFATYPKATHSRFIKKNNTHERRAHSH